jgi:6-pyruvoyltetrahydropterin/6-carboxytetrahydropterin synthase
MGKVKRGIWRLAVRAEFCAAHALRHYEGKCEALHGHNFGVEATVEGEKLRPDTEILADFGELKQSLNGVLEELDHSVLNERPPFDLRNPSSENLARHIWQRLEPRVRSLGLRLHAVTVGEKAAQSATYMEREE